MAKLVEAESERNKGDGYACYYANFGGFKWGGGGGVGYYPVALKNKSVLPRGACDKSGIVRGERPGQKEC